MPRNHASWRRYPHRGANLHVSHIDLYAGPIGGRLASHRSIPVVMEWLANSLLYGRSKLAKMSVSNEYSTLVLVILKWFRVSSNCAVRAANSSNVGGVFHASKASCFGTVFWMSLTRLSDGSRLYIGARRFRRYGADCWAVGALVSYGANPIGLPFWSRSASAIK
ncbi:hypothetical protein OGAPHI_001266 [Ogataea philodendri]|uniref:Uncharacterized protein n=1 Tax=Ogataea philodendri TaxID=1378263 RepID=A0A9P8PFT0_9ASCO|nr:uncharacterized protein OGAPHI_001266 [Ogataea philodendri]KAH3670750.1 hypothetical protein OGAPHI_001266 [Ogataea philodendri]